jgi:hypothetical protein
LELRNTEIKAIQRLQLIWENNPRFSFFHDWEKEEKGGMRI